MDAKERLFNLISETESIDALLSEIAEETNQNFSTLLWKPTFIALQSIVENQCKLTGSSISHTSANVLSSLIKSSFAKSEQMVFLENIEDKSKLNTIIEVGKHFSTCNQFSAHAFAKSLNKKDDSYIPFEVIWMLHKSTLMTLDLFFLCNLDRPAVLSSLSFHLGSMCRASCSHDVESRQTMLYDITTCLLKFAVAENASDVISSGLKKVSQALLDNILKELLMIQDEEQDVNLFSVLNSKALEHGKDFLGSMEKQYLRLLNILLSKKCDEEFSLELFAKHQQLGYNSMNRNLRNLFEELLLLISVEDFFATLKKLLEQKELDWRNGLMFVAVGLVCFPSLASLVEGLTAELLKNSFQSRDAEMTGSAFLLIRHSCIQGCHVCMSYGEWFKKTFKEEGCTTNSKKCFLVFLKFLNDVVPQEPEEFLRVHLQHPPFVPSKCKEEWMNYVALAKTRLSDIKSDVPVTELEQQELIDKIEKDIENALSCFEKDSKLPSTIIEMSLFSRPYFMGKFLPVLLKPRLLPSTQDVKMLFISALHDSSKIPQKLFSEYERDCNQMALDLIEGVIDADEDDDEEMQALQLPMMDQLRLSLKSLQDCVLSNSDKSLSKCLSDVSEKLLAFSKKLIVAPAVIDLGNSKIGNASICQASHQILEFVLQTTHLEMQRRDTFQLHWLDKLVLMLSNHSEVLVFVHQIACNMLAENSEKLSTCHLPGLAALIFHRIHARWEVFGEMRHKEKGFLEYMEEVVKFRNIEQLRQMLTFICSYVALVKESYKEIMISDSNTSGGIDDDDVDMKDEFETSSPGGIIPRKFIDVILFAVPKLHSGLRNPDGTRDWHVAGTSDRFCFDLFLQVVADEKLSFKKWMEYEMDVSESEGTFPPYKDYLAWAVNGGRYFLSDDHDEDRSVLERYCVEIFESIARLGPENSFRCCECHADTRLGVQDKFLSFIYLLQNVACRVVVDHKRPPWLWEGIDRVLKNHLETTARRNLIDPLETVAVERLLRSIATLPPRLLLSNVTNSTAIHEEVYVEGINKMASFVNTFLRKSDPGELLVVDLNATLHFLEALACVDSPAVGDFFVDAPLMTFSVFRHWSEIKLTDVYLKKEGAMERVLCRFGEVVERLSTKFPYTTPFVTYGAAYLGVEYSSLEVFDACVKIARGVVQAVRGARDLRSFDSLLSKLETNPELYASVYNFKDSKVISRTLRLSLPDFVFDLWSSVLVTLFVGLSSKKEFRERSASSLPFLNSLLQSYRDFNEFFDSPSVDRSALYRSPFVTITDASQALRDFLHSIPALHLREVDEKILEKSDFWIRMLVGK